MIDYPNKLNIIFEKLKLFNIKPIIIGGYVRDKLLNIDSKDIDIELYGISSLQELENILQEFGSINSVGKSFGVCKLRFGTLDIDFSLPRVDSKIHVGHTGFKVRTDETLDFITATSRRDFTINAIGYDVFEKKILDPFDGIKDLKQKILKAVDIKKFDEDPLRVMRAVQFSARFDLKLDDVLFTKCKSMIDADVLQELPSERIFEEFKKLLLKSKKPSKGFKLLHAINAFSFFNEFLTLLDKELEDMLKSIDFLQTLKVKNEKTTLTLMLALLCKNLSKQDRNSFLNKLTQEKKLLSEIETFVRHYHSVELESLRNYDIYLLATKLEIRKFLIFLDACYLGEKEEEIDFLKQKAKKLNVYVNSMPPLFQGKDLISLGLKPSKDFSKILDKAYGAQMQELFFAKEEGVEWIKKNLLA